MFINEDEIIKKAAELYLDCPEAQHGDEEIAGYEAELWCRLFANAKREIENEEPTDA